PTCRETDRPTSRQPRPSASASTPTSPIGPETGTATATTTWPSTAQQQQAAVLTDPACTSATAKPDLSPSSASGSAAQPGTSPAAAASAPPTAAGLTTCSFTGLRTPTGGSGRRPEAASPRSRSATPALLPAARSHWWEAGPPTVSTT